MGISLSKPISQVQLEQGSQSSCVSDVSDKMRKWLRGKIQTSPVSKEMRPNCIQRDGGRRGCQLGKQLDHCCELHSFSKSEVSASKV